MAKYTKTLTTDQICTLTGILNTFLYKEPHDYDDYTISDIERIKRLKDYLNAYPENEHKFI